MGKIKHNDYYGYVNKLQTYAIQHPEWFWSDDSKAQEARQWLYNNSASAIIDTIYDETPDNLKPKDRKKMDKRSTRKSRN